MVVMVTEDLALDTVVVDTAHGWEFGIVRVATERHD